MRASRKPFGARLASALLHGAAVVVLGVLAYSAVNHASEFDSTAAIGHFLAIYGAPALVLAAACLWLARTSLFGPVYGLVLLASVVVPLYAADIWIVAQSYDDAGKTRAAAEALGRAYDPRPRFQVVADLRSQGVDAQPFFRLLTERPDTLLLGNTPRRSVVYCNEQGPWLVMPTDRHGFNNPDEAWDRPDKIAIIGDSFAQGACDPDNRGVAALLRDRHPSVVNMAVGGNDPLLNLATIREYAVPAGATRILWFHYAGNDPSGLMAMRRIALLRRYVDDRDFSQALIDRGPEIEAHMERFYEQRLADSTADDRATFASQFFRKQNLIQTAKLQHLRAALGLISNVAEEIDFGLFLDVMRAARQASEAAGAELVVVSIPAPNQIAREHDPIFRETARIMAEAGLRFVDLRPLFAAQPDPMALYAHGARGGHFSPAGNRLVADFVASDVLGR